MNEGYDPYAKQASARVTRPQSRGGTASSTQGMSGRHSVSTRPASREVRDGFLPYSYIYISAGCHRLEVYSAPWFHRSLSAQLEAPLALLTAFLALSHFAGTTPDVRTVAPEEGAVAGIRGSDPSHGLAPRQPGERELFAISLRTVVLRSPLRPARSSPS